jgi:hypothetical protein
MPEEFFTERYSRSKATLVIALLSALVWAVVVAIAAVLWSTL